MPNQVADTSAAQWLAHIANMVGAEASGMLTRYPDGRHSLIAHGHSESAIAEYHAYYGSIDPLPRLLADRPDGRAIVLDTTSHPAFVAQRELSRDYLQKHGIDHVIAAQWLQPDGTLRIVGVQRFRGSEPFPVGLGKELDRQIHHWRIGTALTPPNGFATRGDDSRRACDIAAQLKLPLVIVDSSLILSWANPAAREQQGMAWHAVFNSRTKDPRVISIRKRLQNLVFACLRQRAESEALITASDDIWFATAAPLDGKPGVALLRISPMHHRGKGTSGRLQRLFGLTPAEAELSERLTNGESLETIAEARRVTIDTARTQLRTTFKKTGTHRQGELVSLVSKLSGS